MLLHLPLLLLPMLPLLHLRLLHLPLLLLLTLPLPMLPLMLLHLPLLLPMLLLLKPLLNNYSFEYIKQDTSGILFFFCRIGKPYVECRKIRPLACFVGSGRSG